MKRCSIKSLIPTPQTWQIWHHRGLRTPPRLVTQKLAIKQPSNTELLAIIRQDKQLSQHSTSTLTTRTNLPGFDSQEHNNNISSQTAPLLATHISQLPQSPLVDPNLVAARLRHRAVKPRPSGNPSPFQLKLQKNVFAIALATPPRMCILTGLRLPSYFQITFGVATHPKTGAPWHLPKFPTRAVSDSSNDEMSRITPEPNLPCVLGPKDASKTMKCPVRILSSTHFLASRQVLAHVSGLTPSQYVRLMPYRWKQDHSVKLSDIVWREDMDFFVLEILRRNISKTLSYLASRPAAFIAPCRNYDSINNHSQVAAVLWLSKSADSPVHEKPASGDALSFDGQEIGPPLYAMHYYKTQYIPCYNLATLLGPTQLNALRDSQPSLYGDQFAVVKLKRGTLKVQMELWKLLGYIVQDDNYR